MAHILIADKIAEEGITLLKNAGHEVEEAFDISPDQLLADIPQYDALIVRGRTKVTREVIEKGIKLKVIARAGIGVDNIDVDAAKAKNIAVVNALGATSETVAEHTIALMMALSRNLFPVATALKAGKWEKKTHQAMELKGKTFGIIGYGTIGMRVAEIAAVLGMKIIAYTRTQSEAKKQQLDGLKGQFVSLETLLQESDVISLHIPFSKDTEQLIGAKELALMKPSALFINTARGGVIDEKALVAALRDKKLAGAALDVFSQEPLPVDSHFVELSNCLLTPHVASVSPESATRASMIVARSVDKYLKA